VGKEWESNRSEWVEHQMAGDLEYKKKGRRGRRVLVLNMSINTQAQTDKSYLVCSMDLRL
jgi:hypothetical protein